MASLVKRCRATGFCLLRRRSHGSVSPSRYFSDRNLGAQMMSTGVDWRVMSPWLMLPPVLEAGGDMVYKFYNLSEDKEESFPRNSQEKLADDDAKLVGSSHGYLALLNQRNKNNLFLYNPITHRHIKLPPIETLPDPWTPDGRGIVYKLILSSSPDDDDDDECIAMMIFGLEHRLAFCHPCRSSTEWTPIGELYDYIPGQGVFPRSYDYIPGRGVIPRSYVDIVYSSTLKRFICLSNNTLECWDLADFLSPRIHLSRKFTYKDFPIESIDTHLVSRYLKLVYAEEYNQLFILMQYVMVRMCPDGSCIYPVYFGKNRGWSNNFPYRTSGFDAYKVDFGVEKPQHVEGSLDGLAMFIGINHSFAMSITPELKLSSNCIYYTDSNHVPIRPSVVYGGHDIGIYDYTNRTISPCYYFPLEGESIKRIMPAPLWFTPCHH